MNQEILNLIEMAIADGVITEKERGVILRKAELLGEDKDEAEMILDGKLYEKNKTKSEAFVTPKSDKFGDVRKCPACGAIIQSFQTKCTDCGHEFSNIDATKNIRSFFDKLEQIESTRKSSLMGNLMKGIADDISHKKAQLITGFPVPNTKEDILEFLSQALPQTKVNTGYFSMASESEKIVAKAFKQKCEQLIMKARFSMKEDKKTLEEINNYAKEFGIK